MHKNENYYFYNTSTNIENIYTKWQKKIPERPHERTDGQLNEDGTGQKWPVSMKTTW